MWTKCRLVMARDNPQYALLIAHCERPVLSCVAAVLVPRVVMRCCTRQMAGVGVIGSSPKRGPGQEGGGAAQ